MHTCVQIHVLLAIRLITHTMTHCITPLSMHMINAAHNHNMKQTHITQTQSC